MTAFRCIYHNVGRVSRNCGDAGLHALLGMGRGWPLETRPSLTRYSAKFVLGQMVLRTIFPLVYIMSSRRRLATVGCADGLVPLSRMMRSRLAPDWQFTLWCCQSSKSLVFRGLSLLPRGRSSRWLHCCRVVPYYMPEIPQLLGFSPSPNQSAEPCAFCIFEKDHLNRTRKVPYTTDTCPLNRY